jgi:hypothetical protein
MTMLNEPESVELLKGLNDLVRWLLSPQRPEPWGPYQLWNPYRDGKSVLLGMAKEPTHVYAAVHRKELAYRVLCLSDEDLSALIDRLGLGERFPGMRS